MKLTNRGDTLNDTSQVVVFVAESNAPRPQDDEAWGAAQMASWDKPWRPGKSRKAVLRLRGANFPRPGTYALKFEISRLVPADPNEDTKRHISELGYLPQLGRALTDEEKRDLIEQAMASDDTVTMHKAQMWRAEPMLKGRGGEFLRIEEFSSVLTFFLVAATMLTAIATLVVAAVSA